MRRYKVKLEKDTEKGKRLCNSSKNERKRIRRTLHEADFGSNYS